MNRWNQLFYNKLWFIATVASTLHQNWGPKGHKTFKEYTVPTILRPKIVPILHCIGTLPPLQLPAWQRRSLRLGLAYHPWSEIHLFCTLPAWAALLCLPFVNAICAVGDVSNWGTPEINVGHRFSRKPIKPMNRKHQKDMHIHSRQVCQGCFLLQFCLQSKPCLHKIGQLISEFFRKTSRKGGWWVSLPQRDQTIHSTSTEASNWLQPFVIHLIPPWFEMI